MRAPLDVQLIAIVERQRRADLDQLIKYDTIIDTLNS